MFEIRPAGTTRRRATKSRSRTRRRKGEKVWRVYWQRADLRRQSCQPVREVAALEEFLAVVDEDAFRAPRTIGRVRSRSIVLDTVKRFAYSSPTQTIDSSANVFVSSVRINCDCSSRRPSSTATILRLARGRTLVATLPCRWRWSGAPASTDRRRPRAAIRARALRGESRLGAQARMPE